MSSFYARRVARYPYDLVFFEVVCIVGENQNRL